MLQAAGDRQAVNEFTVGTCRMIHGDCLTVMPTLAAESISSIITDPPYGLSFMGKSWDHGIPGVPFWEAALRVAKPGAHLMAFGGTRTFHRLMTAIEDAGWELRDTLMWVYGSGYPKSLNLEGEHQGWGTALKPAWEPIIMARKPLTGTVTENVAAHGTGAINIDGCRIPVDDQAYARNHSGDRGHGGTRDMDDRRSTDFRTGGGNASDIGRWPANLCHDGSDEVVDRFPQQTSGANPTRRNSAKFRNAYSTFEGQEECNAARGVDSGSAARFFYCSKASREDRNAGCEGLERRPLHWSSGDENPGSFQSDGTDKTSPNNHPTVKPTDLMRWLCRLVTPRGGTILDPFAGSGSTGRAAIYEGFNSILIEQNHEYLEIMRCRVGDAWGVGSLFGEVLE